MEEDEIREMMSKDTFMSASEAVEKGFADEVQEAPEPDANADEEAKVQASMERRNSRLAAVLQAVQG